MEPVTIALSLLSLGKSIVGGFLERKIKKQEHKTTMAVKKQQLKEKVLTAQIESDTNIDKINTENMANSWKDEFVLIMFSIPVILCFIPGNDVFVKAGFDALKDTPIWYQVIFVVMCLTIYGHRKLARMFAGKFLGGRTEEADYSVSILGTNDES